MSLAFQAARTNCRPQEHKTLEPVFRWRRYKPAARRKARHSPPEESEAEISGECFASCGLCGCGNLRLVGRNSVNLLLCRVDRDCSQRWICQPINLQAVDTRHRQNRLDLGALSGQWHQYLQD